jgi:hypothetical protein
MKLFPALVTAWLVGCSAAGAQEPPVKPVTRGDLHFVLGWQNLHKGGTETPNDWVNSIFYGGAGAGWYWTDHLKTQVDFGGGTRGHQFRYTPAFAANPQTTPQYSELAVRQNSVAIAQHYQFFRNQWFHPHVGAGVDIARETTTEVYQPVFGFDNVTRTSRQISPGRIEGPDHRFIARPFVETGFKAYMTRRAFFTSDMRLMARHGIDEVLFRIGFGIDF